MCDDLQRMDASPEQLKRYIEEGSNEYACVKDCLGARLCIFNDLLHLHVFFKSCLGWQIYQYLVAFRNRVLVDLIFRRLETARALALIE